MSRDNQSSSSIREQPWADWLLVHAWWTALLAVGVVCILALVLT
jgi:hypothetical protein